MDAQGILKALFPQGHDITIHDFLMTGRASIAGQQVEIIGTINQVAIGVELALRLAAAVLSCVRERPGAPVLLLIDTSGHRLSRRDEMLGLNGYMAHLAKCVQAARRQGSPVVGLVYAEAVSAGFLATSLLANECYALPEAEIRVMNLVAMSRVTKIPLTRLQALSEGSPIFAPGAANFYLLGGIREIWQGNLSECLREAFARSSSDDRRRADGFTRGGRKQAAQVSQHVRDVSC